MSLRLPYTNEETASLELFTSAAIQRKDTTLAKDFGNEIETNDALNCKHAALLKRKT